MIRTKQNWFRRTLSVLLALIMCIGAVSITVSAATAEPTTPIEKIDVPVEDGVYYADIELLQASNPKQFSMGNAALRGSTSFKQKQPDDTYSKAVVVVKDNKATAIVEFMPMGYIGMYGFMMELESVDVKYLQQWGGVYDKDAVFTPAEVLARHMTADGKTAYDSFNDPSSEYVFNGNTSRPAGFGHDTERKVDISNQPYSRILALDVTPIYIGFTSKDAKPRPTQLSEYGIDNAAYVHVFVPVMFSISPSSGDQYARMKVDWTTLEKIEHPENNLEYTLWSAKQIEQDNYTDASFAKLQNAIADVTAKLENIWPNQTISMNGTGFNAQPTLEQREYSDTEKAEMVQKLNAAVFSLELRGEKEALEALITRTGEISEELYTPESYAEMKAALEAAVNVQKNEDAGVSEVNNAVQNLNDKIDALVYRDADYSSVRVAIEAIPDELFSICTKETAQALQDAQNAVNWTLNITEQSKVEEYARAIREAIAGLVYLGADYTAVSAAIADISADLSVYTDETAQAVRDAKAAVDWTKNKTEQSVVDAYAHAVEDAVGKLVFKPADYTAVDAALAKVPEDLTVYTDETVGVLNAAVNAVVRGKNMSEKELVHDYAMAIEAAINAMIYKPADYSAVDNALADIPLDLSGYTESSVQAVQYAQNAVVRGKNITEQDTVNAMAKRIEEAVASLVLKTSDDQPDKNDLEDGVYSIYGEMIKVNRQDKSMSNDAINHTIKLTVENGKYYLTLDFHGLHYLNRFGYLARLAYYDNGYTYGQYGKIEGSLIPAEVLSTQKNADGSDVIDEFNKDGGSSAGLLYPDQIKFPLISDALTDTDGYVPLHVFVPVMEDISEGTGDQDVLLNLDWSTLTKTTEDDPNFEPDKPVEQSPAVDITDAATGVKIHADKGVFEEGVKVVVTEIKNDSDYDNAVNALSGAVNKFKLYDVKFLDKDGNEVAPNGTVTISFPVSAGYDAAKLAVYRINDGGSKILVKGVMENGMYKVVTKTAGEYALVEKEYSVTDDPNPSDKNNGNADGSNSSKPGNNDNSNVSDIGNHVNSGSNNNSNTSNNSQTGVNAPQTGDSSNLMLWLVLALASAGMMAVLIFVRKRRIKEGE